jgi:hypothetical protein
MKKSARIIRGDNLMTDAEQLQFCERLKAEPESARGMMELMIEILVHQFGAKFTRELALDAVDAAQRKSRGADKM